MHDRLAALNLLLERASAERDSALVALQRAEAALAAAAGQFDRLGRHREEFDDRWLERSRLGIGAPLVQCRHDFGQRLDQAIEMQQAQQQRARRRLDAARATVVEREQRVAAVRKLIERRALAALRIAERFEQRAMDESARRTIPNTSLS